MRQPLFQSVLLLLCSLVMVSEAHAIHPDDWLPEERPEVLDLSTSLTSKEGNFIISYTPPETGVPLNKIHNWNLKVTTRDGRPVKKAIIRLYGDMPEHRHGMVTKPRIRESRKAGVYTVQGMKFHMPGWWVMVFDVSSGNKRDGVMFHFLVGEGEVANCPCNGEGECACPHCNYSTKPTE